MDPCCHHAGASKLQQAHMGLLYLQTLSRGAEVSVLSRKAAQWPWIFSEVGAEKKETTFISAERCFDAAIKAHEIKVRERAPAMHTIRAGTL